MDMTEVRIWVCSSQGKARDEQDQAGQPLSDNAGRLGGGGAGQSGQRVCSAVCGGRNNRKEIVPEGRIRETKTNDVEEGI